PPTMVVEPGQDLVARQLVRRAHELAEGGLVGERVVGRYGAHGLAPRPDLGGPILLEILADEAEENGVHPGAVAPVRLALDALAHEAGALGVADRPLVEPVALELEPVEAELEDQVPLQGTRRPVGEAAAAERGVDREPAEARDAVARARELEADRPGALPAAPVLDLDHEATDGRRPDERPPEVARDAGPAARARGGQERPAPPLPG